MNTPVQFSCEIIGGLQVTLRFWKHVEAGHQRRNHLLGLPVHSLCHNLSGFDGRLLLEIWTLRDGNTHFGAADLGKRGPHRWSHKAKAQVLRAVDDNHRILFIPDGVPVHFTDSPGHSLDLRTIDGRSVHSLSGLRPVLGAEGLRQDAQGGATGICQLVRQEGVHQSHIDTYISNFNTNKKKIKGRSDSWKIKAHFKCYSNETNPQEIGVNLNFSKVYYNLQWEL